jgi:peptide/nickel transport system substrate-binding protein
VPAQTAATPVPTAAPTATAVPAALAPKGPYGALNIAFKELGPYTGNPSMTSWPQYGIVQLAAYEGFVGRDGNKEWFPKLFESWSVAEDTLTWTFKLREGIPFHGDWGEVTAEDVIWSIQETAAEGSTSGKVTQIKRIWINPDGWVKALDDHTIQLNTGQPAWDILVYIAGPTAAGAWVVSKAQVDQEGREESNSRLVGTGPWEMIDHSTNEWWKFKAVEGHWRKTPEFADLTLFEIPEAATRIANFQTGKIDTFAAAPNEIPVLAETPGTKFMAQEGSSESSLRIYGNWYHKWGQDDQWPGYDPDLPYVSSNPDVNSPEWDAARKVRLALGLAIDREKLVDKLLQGEGKPSVMWGWACCEDRIKAEWKWEYDPARARQLLAEAGYSDGFELTLSPSIRGAPAEIEACEAIADMMADIGVKAKLEVVPFNTLVDQQFARTYNGLTCHAGPPLVEPLVFWGYLFPPDGNWSAGSSHPYLTENLDKAMAIFNKEERWKVQMEMGQFLWDNALDIGLYTVNNIYPLGPKIDSWEEHLETGDPRRLSSIEYAPRRREE